MRQMFEIFVQSNENWMESSVVQLARSAKRRKRAGKYVWVRYLDLEKEYTGSILVLFPY